mmetsp:Transcript_5916/g.6476  ORF Transcript_5916/g.6476 Transcript_5916/m.6476 type:complete len:95 (-) Transcript_5916:242-526(-)
MIPLGWWRENGWTQTNPQAMQVNSLIKLVESLYSILQNCFPFHPSLNNPGDPPAWWTNIKRNLTKGYTKQKQKVRMKKLIQKQLVFILRIVILF